MGAIYYDNDSGNGDGFTAVTKFTRCILDYYMENETIFTNTNYKHILIQFVKVFGFDKRFEFVCNKDPDTNLFHVHVELCGSKFPGAVDSKKKEAEQKASKIVIDTVKITEEMIEEQRAVRKKNKSCINE